MSAEMLYRALEVANDRTTYARRRFLDIALLWAHHGATTDHLETHAVIYERESRRASRLYWKWMQRRQPGSRVVV